MYTVKQIADLAQVSVRTLHYYDEIALLTPTQVGDNGYRYYDDDALLRLQQILLYREIGLELNQIKDVLDSPDFDVVAALQSHRTVLRGKIERLHRLIATVDETIDHLTGGTTMSKKRMFAAFSQEQEEDYTRQARLEYGPDRVNESVQRWNSYSAAQKQAIMDEGNQVYAEIVDAIVAGLPAHHETVQALLVRWHNHIRHFYEPSLDLLRGLGDLYCDSPDFREKFDTQHADLAEYMREGIIVYVDALETAEIERLLAADAALRDEE